MAEPRSLRARLAQPNAAMPAWQAFRGKKSTASMPAWQAFRGKKSTTSRT